VHLQSAQSISISSCPIKRALVSPSAACRFLGRPPWTSRVSFPLEHFGVCSVFVCFLGSSASAPPDFKFHALRFSIALSRTSDVSYVHRSPRHRGRHASPPRRFVCPGCSAGNWTAAGAAVGLAVSCGDRMGSADPDRRGALPDADFWIDLVWSAAIGLVLAALAPALPNQFAQTAPSGPTSSMARSATLNRRPASSSTYIYPYAIVTAALSQLAGSSPPAPRPCMHGGLGHPGRD
jgi:hypothetical protein